jgi:hypothetical protein
MEGDGARRSHEPGGWCMMTRNEAAGNALWGVDTTHVIPGAIPWGFMPTGARAV